MRGCSILLISLMLSACAEEIPKDEVIIDAQVMPYVEQFINDAHSYGVYELSDTSVILVDTLAVAGSSVGLCTVTLRGKTITILRSWWNMNDDKAREIVIYHEMGHCALGRMGHNNGQVTTQNGLIIPVSILNPNVINSNYFVEHRDAYLLELFKLDQSGPWL